MSFFKNQGKFVNFGLLFLRFGIGIMMVLHGVMKYKGGETVMQKIGSAATNIGINSFHTELGYIAASVEILGGLLVILGFYFTPACLLLAMVLSVAFISKISGGGGFPSWAYPFEIGLLFLTLSIIGPGKYSFDNKGKGNE